MVDFNKMVSDAPPRKVRMLKAYRYSQEKIHYTGPQCTGKTTITPEGPPVEFEIEWSIVYNDHFEPGLRLWLQLGPGGVWSASVMELAIDKRNWNADVGSPTVYGPDEYAAGYDRVEVRWEEIRRVIYQESCNGIYLDYPHKEGMVCQFCTHCTDDGKTRPKFPGHVCALGIQPKFIERDYCCDKFNYGTWG
jgi:hypothetical protein